MVSKWGKFTLLPARGHNIPKVCKRYLAKVRKLADTATVKGLFDNPVNNEDYPDYPAVVSHPMWLNKVEVGAWKSARVWARSAGVRVLVACRGRSMLGP